MIALLVCALELMIVPIFLFKRFDNLDDERNKKRCGYMYEELNHKIRGRRALLYPIFYQLRFCILIAMALFVKVLVFQAMSIVLSTILIMWLLGSYHPFKVVSRNYKEILSEFVIIVVMDLLLFSSDPALDVNSRALLGWAVIGIMGLSIIFSQGSLMVSICKDACRKLYLIRVRRANRAAYTKRMKLMKTFRKSMNARDNQIEDVQEHFTFGADEPDSETATNKRARLAICDRTDSYKEDVVGPIDINEGIPASESTRKASKDKKDKKARKRARRAARDESLYIIDEVEEVDNQLLDVSPEAVDIQRLVDANNSKSTGFADTHVAFYDKASKVPDKVELNDGHTCVGCRVLPRGV